MKKSVSTLLFCVLPFVIGIAACKKGKDAQTAAEVEVEPTRPAPPSGTMSLQGYYSMAGSTGSFQVCGTGQQWRVSQEGDVAALEKAYREANVQPGSGLLVEVEGGIGSRPKPDGAGDETMLIVARFIGSFPGRTCPGD
ncbi:MAG TPA: hypothetical protein VLS88_13820 [Polyangiales bacterium]|nr:hypothetical protein [Polyangiales bacterium]